MRSSLLRLSSANLWKRAPQQTKAPAAGAGFDLSACADSLGLLPDLQRRPWVIRRETCEEMAKKLGVSDDDLLGSMVQWSERSLMSPVVAGLGSLSGSIFLGPAIDFGAGSKLMPAQALIANLFAHSEGLEAICASSVPCKVSEGILRELAMFPEVRWVNTQSQDFSGAASLDGFGFNLHSDGNAKLADIVGGGGG